MNSKGIIIDKSLQRDTKLYRYMCLSQFMSFVETRKTYLTRLLFWEDKWEVPTIRFLSEVESCSNINFNDQEVKDLYGQCWSLEGVSDALWRIYSREGEGILIQTTVQKFDLIQEITYGMLSPVIYYDNLRQVSEKLSLETKDNSFLTQGLFKRKAFEHEKEVRLITLKDEVQIGNKSDSCSRLEISLNPLDFIDEIIIDPRAKDWYVKTIIDYCKRSGFKITPQKSDLYCSKDHI
ncbi:hypothetical protein J2Z44_000567 [Clostridium punense]|uniref:DUF2971 domain-containing protein n=1 Tax=Clostridium punense TaxID=1054297 RepID=A0ABS4JZ33_9CLOT|nr:MULTISPECIES: DUF2971 domain-containing protein [Clostridium]EQB87542.1 hypothetical protein M918_09115 [Clostridium sp. BL8]MBP2020783.1 hypothetical protein [Clostridium punense]